MRDVTQPVPAIKITQQQQEAKFLCSACGADRFCNCNAPAVERLAEKLEQDRKRAKAYRERKAEEDQSPRHVTQEPEPAEPAPEPEPPPRPTNKTPIMVEHEILDKLAHEIIEIGFQTMAARFCSDKTTMARLRQVRDELRESRRVEFF